MSKENRRRKENYRVSASIVAATVALFSALPVAAQQASHQSDNSDKSQEVQEIVVTAGKRSQVLSKVAGAVSALPGEKLEERSADSMQDYLAFIPGISLDNTSGNVGHGTLQIRGIATQSIGASVATYIDETPVGAASAVSRGGQFASDIDPNDLERVEVLKGPQGTLYGASSLGGVVKYVTRAPNLTEFEARASEDFSVTRHGSPTAKLRGSVSVPIVEGQLALRVSGYYRHEGGFIDVVGRDRNFNSSDDRGFRASLLYKPTDNLSIRLNAMYQDSQGSGSASYDVDPVTLEPVFGDLKQLPLSGEFNLKASLYSAEVDYDLGAVSLVSATSYSTLKPVDKSDVTRIYQALGSPYASLETPLLGEGFDRSNKFTQELRLVSERMGGFEWMIGGFFQSERLQSDYSMFQFDLNGNRTSLAPFSIAKRSGKLKEYAGFVNLTYYITDRFDISAGYRHSQIDQDQVRITSGIRRNPSNPLLETVSVVDSSENSETYLGAIRWQATDNLTLYGRAASGYRPGGPRPVPDTAPPGTPDYFTSDTIWSYEAGAKFRGLDNRLTIDAAAFWIDWTNIQALELFPPFVTDGNAGAARSRGFELAVAAVPTDGLNVGFSAAYTDAKYTEEAPAVGVSVGDRLTYVPKWTAAAYFDYTKPISGEWDGFVGGDVQYMGPRLSYYSALPEHTLLNFNLGIRNPKYRLNFYVQNLTDKRAAVGTSNGGLPGLPLSLAVNRPRTFGVTFAQSF
ncbi:TonB-dependent receptor [Sphingopyxis panaciterrae]